MKLNKPMKKKSSQKSSSTLVNLVAIAGAVIGLFGIFTANYYQNQNTSLKASVISQSEEIKKVPKDFAQSPKPAASESQEWAQNYLEQLNKHKRIIEVVNKEDNLRERILFFTPDCQLGLIARLEPFAEIKVGACETANNCQINKKYRLASNAHWFPNQNGKLILVGTIFEGIISNDNLKKCLNQKQIIPN
jgi:hypothetical protein